MKSITTQHALLLEAQALLEKQGAGDFSLSLPDPYAKSPEVRVKHGATGFSLVVHPFLNPTRRDVVPVAHALLLAPHIPPELAAICRAAGINHADLNGRLFICTAGVLIDREPRQKEFQGPEADPDLFAPKSARVVRALLCVRDRAWTQAELTEATGVSTALVSRILTALEAGLHVTREKAFGRGVGATYRVRSFDELLDAWAQADKWRKRVAIHQFSALGNDVGGNAAKVRDALAGERVVFTQWIAAWLRHPHTVPPLVSAYVDAPSLAHLTHAQAFARPVAQGGNIWLIVPKDDGVFRHTREVGGCTLASDVQIYLDLLRAGLRGPEQAQALRAWEGFAR